jgi:hypothetical protein
VVIYQVLFQGLVIIYGGGGGGGGGVAPKRNVFRGKYFSDPTRVKKSKIWLPNLKYQLKNEYPPLAIFITQPLSCFVFIYPTFYLLKI